MHRVVAWYFLLLGRPPPSPLGQKGTRPAGSAPPIHADRLWCHAAAGCHRQHPWPGLYLAAAPLGRRRWRHRLVQWLACHSHSVPARWAPAHRQTALVEQAAQVSAPAQGEQGVAATRWTSCRRATRARPRRQPPFRPAPIPSCSFRRGHRQRESTDQHRPPLPAGRGHPAVASTGSSTRDAR